MADVRAPGPWDYLCTEPKCGRFYCPMGEDRFREWKCPEGHDAPGALGNLRLGAFRKKRQTVVQTVDDEGRAIWVCEICGHTWVVREGCTASKGCGACVRARVLRRLAATVNQDILGVDGEDHIWVQCRTCLYRHPADYRDASGARMFSACPVCTTRGKYSTSSISSRS